MMTPDVNTNSRSIVRVNFLGKRELQELKDLMMPEEQLLAAISGYYTAGFALLCVTTHRVLLIDKKLVRLNIEDVRFDSVREVNYSHQALFASLSLYFSGRALQFKTWHRDELKQTSQLVQQKMFEMREKLHRKEDEVVEVVSVKQDDERSVFPYTNTRRRARMPIDKFVSQRVKQWQRADLYTRRTILPLKAGREILKLEQLS